MIHSNDRINSARSSDAAIRKQMLEQGNLKSGTQPAPKQAAALVQPRSAA